MASLISVIVTCYNHQEYIKECLESIFQQTYQQIELIVYNDGSTDDSPRLIKETLQESPFEKTLYHSHKNKGLVATRNLGLAAAQGEFILFVDSDNFLEPNYVEAMLQTAQKEDLDIVYPTLFDPATKSIYVPARYFDLEDLLVSNYIDSCSLTRRKVIQDAHYDMYLNYKKLEDYDFYLNLIVNKGAKAGPCLDTHLNYRVLENSMSDRENLVKYYSIYTYILNKYTDSLPLLTEKALKENAKLILNENMMAHQVIKVYYSEGEEYSAEKSFDLPLKDRDSQEFHVEREVTHLRIDLSEIPSYYSSVRLTIGKRDTEVLPQTTNGIRLRNSFIFYKNDPQIIYDIHPFEERDFTLTYDTYNLYDLTHEDYIGRVLGEQIKELKETSVNRNQYYHVIRERNQLKAQLVAREEEYQKVISSRRWTLITKLIHLFRRQK